MRTLPAGPVTPLLGSLGLHGCAVLLLALAVRRPLELARTVHEHADAWAGTALEVDAVATPDGVPTIPNAPSPADAAAAAEAAPPAQKISPISRDMPAEQDALAIAQPPSDAPPAPKKKRHRTSPRPNAVASPERDSMAASTSEGTDKPARQAATGAFGSVDLPPGVRSLPSAFTRAIPPATGADPIWQTLPAGQQRAFVIAVRVAADGHIEDSRFLGNHEESSLPEQFRHLRERVLALLGAGLFALQNDLTAGYGVFRITITLSDRAVKNEGAPAELVERGFDPPHGTQPGRAYFTLASGRHFEAKVEVLNTPRLAHP